MNHLDYTAMPTWVLLACGAVWLCAFVGAFVIGRTIWQFVRR